MSVGGICVLVWFASCCLAVVVDAGAVAWLVLEWLRGDAE